MDIKKKEILYEKMIQLLRHTTPRKKAKGNFLIVGLDLYKKLKDIENDTSIK